MLASAVAQDSTALQLSPPSQASQNYDNPVWSPDGKFLAMSGAEGRGVLVADLTAGTCRRIAGARASGYALNWSADSIRLGFKRFVYRDDSPFPLQQPVVFDLSEATLTALTPPVARAGVPSFSNDGKLAWTLGTELHVRSSDGGIEVYALDHYANLAPISPDGSKVAYNDKSHAICVLDLATRKQKELTADGLNCFEPVWSGDSSRLVVSTLGGKLISIDVDSGADWELGEGSDASWLPDSQTIIFTRSTRHEGVRLLDSNLWAVRFDGQNQSMLTSKADRLETSAAVSADGSRVVYMDLADGRMYQAGLTKALSTAETMETGGSVKVLSYQLAASTAVLPEDAPVTDLDAAEVIEPDSSGSGEIGTSSITTAAAGQVWLRRPCPYVHQVYDTADSFNGHWACGATSAIMAIQYYETMPAWDMTCSLPYRHVSAFGRYVSAIYSFNGHTYNIGSPDPNGNPGYGGYGYIVRNNWADTKGYMRDYFRNHGLGSDVDWSPTWAELRNEIDADRPFVVLNSLTTAGHYITAIGYFENQHTAIFNDPYGNKNTPGYPSYDGAGVFYDWPGYHNGYQNLKTVHCFIYCRGGSPPTITLDPVDREVARGATTTFTVAAVGLGPFGYQWRKNGNPVVDGGHYSGVTTTTLTINNIDSSDTGMYSCLVSNSYGSVLSQTAQLRISSPDFDGDGDVDSEDFAVLQACVGVTVYTRPDCTEADLDGDGDVDPHDVSRFHSCFAGPRAAPPAGCID